MKQRNWLEACEKRVAATKSMLTSLKAIKMMGIEQDVALDIQTLRQLEFMASKLFRSLMVGSVFICKQARSECSRIAMD